MQGDVKTGIPNFLFSLEFNYKIFKKKKLYLH
jgi:hypothetical protein